MEESLQKSDKLEIWKKDQITHRVVTGMAYGEEIGYNHWLELETFNKSYKVTPAERDSIIATAEKSKFIQMGDEMIAVHQIKGIFRHTSNFGPRAGEA